MQTIQAKVKVVGKTNIKENEIKVTMQAVTSESEENKSYSKWTPTASFVMTITNEDAFTFFEVDEEFIVSFTRSN